MLRKMKFFLLAILLLISPLERPQAVSAGVQVATYEPGFISARSVAIGGVSNRLAVGDFNGDGWLDAASLISNFDSVKKIWIYSLGVVLGNGNETAFQPPVVTPLPDPTAQPWFFLAGDLNSDGKDELIIFGNNTKNSLSAFQVYFGNVDGSLTQGTAAYFAPSGDSPYGVHLFDVNGDGHLDVVVIGSGSRVYTALGKGDGTFQTSTYQTIDTSCWQPVLVDLNDDEKLDIVCFTSPTYSARLQVILSTSTGYASHAFLTTESGTLYNGYITVADVNKDGKPDIITADSWQGSGIYIYLNLGDGAYSTGVRVWAGAFSSVVEVADLNGDGNPDLVVGNQEGGDITILFGTGSGAFSSPDSGYAVGEWGPRQPGDIVVRDFNKDGKPDLLLAECNPRGLSYLLNMGAGVFKAARTYYSDDTPTRKYTTQNVTSKAATIAVGDLNGDGLLDAVVTRDSYNKNGPGLVTVFLARPDGTYQTGVSYGPPTLVAYMYEGVVLADFTGDGKLDVLATDNERSLLVFPGKGDGTLDTPVKIFTVADPTYLGVPLGLVAADFNHDGKVDIAIHNNNMLLHEEIAVLINHGNNTTTIQEYPFNYPSLESAIAGRLALGDLNSDGSLDLVAPELGEYLADNHYQGVLAVLLGKGDGTFQLSEIPLDFPKALGNCGVAGIAVGDLNLDSKPDVVLTLSANDGNAYIVELLGNGDGTFAPYILFKALETPNNVGPGIGEIHSQDMNGDGWPDLIFTLTQPSGVTILYSQGVDSQNHPVFASPVVSIAAAHPFSVALTDLNGDGRLDYLAAGWSFGGLVASYLEAPPRITFLPFLVR